MVAHEIKELALQTANSTSEIKKRVDGIQSSTMGTVEQINKITKVINDVNEIVSTISSALEEQAVTTKEIAANIENASAGNQQVNKNVDNGGCRKHRK